MVFRTTVDEQVRAYTQGVPSYIRRRRRIEDLEARLVELLWSSDEPNETASSAAFGDELAVLNDLISRHNRYYPIEANLPIEVRTGRLLDRGRPWQPLPAVTTAVLLARALTR